MEIRMITKAEADDIIATREPRGLFYLDTGKSFVGIDRACNPYIYRDRVLRQLRAGGRDSRLGH